jgi:ribosomal protein S18 acetylase RimI-like enzyme
VERVEIREAAPEDYVAAGDVAVAAYEEFYEANLGYYADRLRDVASRAKDAAVLVAVERGEIIGTVTYVPDGTSSYAEGIVEGEAGIRMLSVAPSHKRRGIGRALSVACIERARSEGKVRLVLHADRIQEAAQALYRSLGFHRRPERDFRPDDETFLVCYVLDL